MKNYIGLKLVVTLREIFKSHKNFSYFCICILIKIWLG